MSEAAVNHLPPPPSKIAVGGVSARCLSAASHELPTTYLSAFAGGNASPILGDPSQSLPCSCGATTDGHECRCGSGSTPLPMQETLILPLGMDPPLSANQIPLDPDSPADPSSPAAAAAAAAGAGAGALHGVGPAPASTNGSLQQPALQQQQQQQQLEQQGSGCHRHHGAVFAGAAALAVHAPHSAEGPPAAGAAAVDGLLPSLKTGDGDSSCPPFAVKSTCGKRSNMEDTYALCPNICELPMSPMAADCADKFPQRIAMQLNSSTLQPYMTAATAASEDIAALHANTNGSSAAAAAAATAAAAAAAVAAAPGSGGSSAQSTPPAAGQLDTSAGSSSSGGGSSGACVEQLHFFGVYDGHGGTEASLHCAQRLHHHLSQALSQIGSVWCDSNQFMPCMEHVQTTSWDEGEVLSPDCTSGEPAPFGRTISATSGSNSNGDSTEGEGGSTSSGEDPGSDATYNSISCMMEQALRNAFLKTDEEFSGDNTAGLVGSTAVVALVGTHRVWIANCGDSRAVLSRNGRAIQVTDDHKPEREDEAARVEKAGGQVLYWNGHRVMGVLAMSRAIGDHCLRPYVIPEPEISVFARHAKDEIMLLASDGLWDVMSNQEATDLALRAIRRAQSKGASKKAAARVAATVLTKAAVDRGSRDNITVVIIDLSRSQTGPVAVVAQGPSCQEQSVAGGTREAPAAPGAAAAAVAECAVPGAAGGPTAAGPSEAVAEGAAVGGMQVVVTRCSSGKGSRNAGSPFGAAAGSPFDSGHGAAAGTREAPGSSAGSSRVASSAGSGPPISSFSTAAEVALEAGEEGAGGEDGGSRGSSRLLDAGHATSLVQELQTLDLRGATPAGLQHFAGAVASGAASEATAEQLQEQLTMVPPPPPAAAAAAAAGGATA